VKLSIDDLRGIADLNRGNNEVSRSLTIVQSSVTGVPEPGATPRAFANGLFQNYPNPFNPVTTIEFQLAGPRFVRLDIFDVRGGHVKGLVRHVLDEGVHKVTWDGLNENGIQLSSGIYLMRLEAGDFVATRKMVLLR